MYQLARNGHPQLPPGSCQLNLIKLTEPQSATYRLLRSQYLLLECRQPNHDTVDLVNIHSKGYSPLYVLLASTIFERLLEKCDENPKQMRLAQLFLYEFPLTFTIPIITCVIDITYLQRPKLYRYDGDSAFLNALCDISPSSKMARTQYLLGYRGSYKAP